MAMRSADPCPHDTRQGQFSGGSKRWLSGRLRKDIRSTIMQEAMEMIQHLPKSKELRVYELTIHLRALELGQQRGLKLRNFIHGSG